MTTANTFHLTRQLKAPRQLVWDAWTQSDHLAKWFSPTGFTTTIHKLDLSPKGTMLYSMKTPEGFEMWGRWLFQEVEQPTRLVLIQHFSDEHGGITRHPASPTWPQHTLSTMTLEERNGETILNLEWTPYEASEEEIATFNAAFDSMNQGWGGTFENLENYLAKIQ